MNDPSNEEIAMQGRVQTMANVFTGGERRSWQDIDRELRALAQRQRALDAEEAILLCAVVRYEIWRQLGAGGDRRRRVSTDALVRGVAALDLEVVLDSQRCG